MLARIEKELVKYDSEIGTKLNILRPNEEGKITIEELEDALKVIKDNPNDYRIKKIVKKLDTDGDGVVALHEILVIAEQAESNNEGTGVVVDKKATSATTSTSTATTAASETSSSTSSQPPSSSSCTPQPIQSEPKK